MAVSETDVINGLYAILNASWSKRQGQVVPESDDVVLANGAVELDATYVYADMAGSSTLAHLAYPEVTAKIIRCYISAASRILRGYGGEIRSFDGDRVMAIFIGNNKNTSAVRAALALNWAVAELLRPKIAEKWQDVAREWTLQHGVGVDTGEALLVRGGVRGNNDLISIGSAPNIAAKLSKQRGAYQMYITQAVYDSMDHSVSHTTELGYSRPMWVSLSPLWVGRRAFQVKGSSFYWGP